MSFIIVSLATLIFLYDIIRWDVSATSSTLKVFMKFWRTYFKFWLRPWFILSKGNFINGCVLSQCKVYSKHFQNIHTLTYQKTLLHTLFCLFLKSLKPFSVSLKAFNWVWLFTVSLFFLKSVKKFVPSTLIFYFILQVLENT